jgi:8-oxo-dGTP pyrophosphatase MutT (NUDIX family)
VKTLAIFDRKNYDLLLPRYIRYSSRAIIIVDKKIALLSGTKYKMYVFPGGRIEEGETNTEALIRETKEEAGLVVKPQSIKEFGMVSEIRKDIYVNGIFEQHDFYYTCDVEDKISEPKLSDEEKKIGLQLEFISIDKAISINEIEMEFGNNFSERETFILKLLNILLDINKFIRFNFSIYIAIIHFRI